MGKEVTFFQQMFNLKTKYFPTLKQAKNQQVSKTELEKPERKFTYNHS